MDKQKQNENEKEKEFYRLLSLHNFNFPEKTFQTLKFGQINLIRFEKQLSILNAHKTSAQFSINVVLKDQLYKEHKVNHAGHNTCTQRIRFLNIANSSDGKFFHM